MEIRWKGRLRRVVTMIGRQQLKIHNECVLYYGQLFEGQRCDDRVWGRRAAWGKRQVAIGPLLYRISEGGRVPALQGALPRAKVQRGVDTREQASCWLAGLQVQSNAVGAGG